MDIEYKFFSKVKIYIFSEHNGRIHIEGREGKKHVHVYISKEALFVFLSPLIHLIHVIHY